MAEEVREVNPNVHWYSLHDLMNKFPIQNKRWQYDGGVSFEYFYDLDEHIETDPESQTYFWVRTDKLKLMIG